jgi:hypothetical protein
LWKVSKLVGYREMKTSKKHFSDLGHIITSIRYRAVESRPVLQCHIYSSHPNLISLPGLLLCQLNMEKECQQLHHNNDFFGYWLSVTKAISIN